MTIDDIIAMQSIDQVAISPDGQWLAAVIKPSGGPVMWDAHTDIWLVPRHGGGARNITGSNSSETRWWHPVWSPDGKRLAMYAITNDSTATPYVWTLQSGAFTKLTDRDIDRNVSFDASFPRISMVWVDSVTMLCPVLPNGTRTGLAWGSATTTQRVAPQDWEKTNKGIEPSVSVLESGREIPVAERAQGQLLRMDVRTKVATVIATGNFWQILVSPTGRLAALIADRGRRRLSATERLPYLSHVYDTRRSELAFVRLDSIAPAHWIPAVPDPEVSAFPLRHAWSPDGTTLAVIARLDSNAQFPQTAYLVSATTGAIRQLTDRTFAALRTAWTGNTSVLVYGNPTAYAPVGSDTARSDWWTIDARIGSLSKGVINLTSHLRNVPSDVAMLSDTSMVIGVADGRIVELDTESHVIPTEDTTLRGLLWPSKPVPPGARPSELFVNNAAGDIYRVTTQPRLALKAVPRPSTSAELVAVDSTERVAAFLAEDRTGSVLSMSDGTRSRFETKFALNQYLARIADAKLQLINYVDADGDSLKALVILPNDYAPGHRYPLITYVYGGAIVSDTTITSGSYDKKEIFPLKLTLLTGRGYAVLIPSMPLGPEGVASDPAIDISKGVISAVDAAIRLGIADPTKLGLMGHSYGGYSVYSLLTYTHRFQAAIALAGFADIASTYGQLTAESRYTAFGYEFQHDPALAESGQIRMGDSPWGNLWRYIRNSPYFFADRVETPLMIIQGDMDDVPIEEGERFFSALYRMGKPAALVRYWGEGHIIQRSPANVRDMWSRINTWFDKYLNVTPESRVAGGPSAGHSR